MGRTSDHKVPGLNPAGGRIPLMTVVLHFTEPIIITFLSSRYDLDNVEREVKHQPIIIRAQLFKANNIVS